MATLQEENPQLYNYLGKQYLYTDLQRAVENNIDSYLSSIKGDENRQRTRDAIYNLLSGYGDNSISYQNGRFVDSRGRYENNIYYDVEGNRQTSDKDDYYGAAASFLRRQLGKSKEYTSENSTSSKKTTPSQSLLQRIFNTDTNPNYYYFADNDLFDEETGTRGITRRAAILLPLIQEDIDNTTDENQKRILQAAYQSIVDNTIDAGDYYALSRAYSDVPWEKVFYTGRMQSSDNSGQQQTQTPQYNIDDFVKWYQELYPTFTGDSSWHSLVDNEDYGEAGNSFVKKASQYDSKELTKVLNTLINGDQSSSNYSNRMIISSILNTLRNRGELTLIDSNNQGLYYIPQLTDSENKGAVYLWDSNNNTMRKASRDSIPFFQKQMVEEWMNKDNDWYDQFFTISQHKLGGVLKAQSGISFSNIYAGGSNPDIGYNTYLNRFFLDPKVIAQMNSMFNGDLNRYADFVKNNVNTRYSAGINDYQNSKTYLGSDKVRAFNTGYQNAGNTFNYTLFGNSNDDYNNRQNGVAYQYASFTRPTNPMGTGDRWNQDVNTAYIDNALGLQTYSRVASLTDSALTNFGNWGEYWKSKGATGAYYYKAEGDKSGRGQWIPTNDTSIEGYRAFDTESPIESPIETPVEDVTNNTYVNPSLTETSENNPSFTSSGWLSDLYPDLLGVGRMALSLRTNNKVAKTLTEATKPTLLNTYELYSPVTGAFSEMQFRNRQAADLRRQAARPFTSDASLQLAGNLDANRQARDLEYQGFLADDKEIKRTKEEALKRQEDNVARRTDVANKNRAAINESNWQKAQIEAQRLKSNWGSVDNYLQGVETRLRTRFAENKALKQNTSSQYAQNLYSDAIQTLNRQYKEQNPDATTSSMLQDQNYIDKVNELKRRYQYDLYNIASGRYYTNPYSGVVKSYNQILNSKRGVF